MATPKLAHIVFQTAQPQAMRDFYCTLLEAHVVYSDDNLSFMTYDDEHHRIALLPGRHLDVRLRRRQRRVPQQPHDLRRARTVLRQPGRERVPQRVQPRPTRHPVPDARPPITRLHQILQPTTA